MPPDVRTRRSWPAPVGQRGTRGWRIILVALVALVGPACAGPRASPSPGVDPLPPPDLSAHFGDLEGTFVLLDGRTGERVVHDSIRAGRRYLPASTFKIVNALIALEIGVADGAEFPLVRDPVSAPRQEWWPGSWDGVHTLRSAFGGSVVWYYQEIARRIGAEAMRERLLRFGYGNGDLSGGIDAFWLEGGFGISANEQVEFLQRLQRGELGVSERSTRIVREMLVLEEGPGYRLSGKSGWAGFGDADAPQLGWLVGFVERGEEVAYFALNVDLRTPADAAARLSITRAILSELGLLPGDATRRGADRGGAIRQRRSSRQRTAT